MKEELARAEAGVDQLLEARNDRWYPSFHIAARAGWINDPNGISYVHGRYHVFFQHHPWGTNHGPMHWGHVSSSDMVTWRREPIAFAPSTDADLDGVYSGSAVVADDGTMVVYYTGHRWFGEEIGARQVQCMAVSDDGITFEKRGVVIDPPEGIEDARDPKVWRIGETWYMVIGVRSLENRAQVWLYASQDMENWQFDRVLFEDPDPDAYMPECPDMFPLGDKWVIVYCPMGLTPAGYQSRNTYNGGYVVGNWAPGRDFEQLTEYRPIDWGHNFYAPQSFEAPDGRRIVYGWLGSFTIPIATQESDSWCGQLTVPRELSLDENLRLRSFPVVEIEELRSETTDFGEFELGMNEDRVLMDDGDAVEIELNVDLAATTSERVGLKVHSTPSGGHTYVAYDDLARRVQIDRRLAGNGDRGLRAAPYEGGDQLSLRVLVDRGSIEVFVNGGAESLTSFSFPNEGPRAVVLTSESGTIAVTGCTVHRLRSIWETPDK